MALDKIGKIIYDAGAKCVKDGDKYISKVTHIVPDDAGEKCPCLRYITYQGIFRYAGGYDLLGEILSKFPPFKKCPDGCEKCSVEVEFSKLYKHDPDDDFEYEYPYIFGGDCAQRLSPYFCEIGGSTKRRFRGPKSTILLFSTRKKDADFSEILAKWKEWGATCYYLEIYNPGMDFCEEKFGNSTEGAYSDVLQALHAANCCPRPDCNWCAITIAAAFPNASLDKNK